jgi:D-xylose 1-dehydrogenase (NADP+, D-xylono-1,5-lactone-forming)
MPKVRWGLLSTANINKALIPAIRASIRGELVAVASRSQEHAQWYAQKWEIPQAFGSYEAMLASDEVDVVYIGLPNHLHAEWSIRALHAGKHVLCEKPFALSLEEVDAMSRASQETGKTLAEAFMYLHHPQTQLAREIVRRGDLGDICLVRGVFNFIVRDPDNVRLIPDYGGGCLWDVGVYPLSFAQMIYGNAPEWVFGDAWIGKSGVDEIFGGHLHYAGGGMAQISSSFRSPWFTLAEIIGTTGRLELSRPFVRMEDGRRMTLVPNDGEPYDIPVSEPYLYQGEVEDMHDVILEGATPRISLAESRRHVQTVLALYRSAASSQPVRVK